MTSWFHLLTFSVFRTPTREELYNKRIEKIDAEMMEGELTRISLEAERSGLLRRLRFLNEGVDPDESTTTNR